MIVAACELMQSPRHPQLAHWPVEKWRENSPPLGDMITGGGVIRNKMVGKVSVSKDMVAEATAPVESME
jgi:hypothetical protein